MFVPPQADPQKVRILPPTPSLGLEASKPIPISPYHAVLVVVAEALATFILVIHIVRHGLMECNLALAFSGSVTTRTDSRAELGHGA